MARLSDKHMRARLHVVAAALEYMSGTKALISRREFFAPPEKGATADVIHVCRSKSWQQPLLDRMVKADLLATHVKNGQMHYRISDDALVRVILDDHRNQGLQLTALLFPSEVSYTQPSKTTTESANAHAVQSLSTASEPEDAVERLAGLMMRLIEVVNANSANSQVAATDIIKRIDLIGEMAVKITAATDANPARLGTIEKKLGGNNKRLEELDRRVAEQCGKLDKQLAGPGQDALLAKITEAVERAVHLHMGDIGGHVAEIARDTKGVPKLQATTDVITAHLKAARRDRLAATLERLDANQAEAAALRDMLVEELAKHPPKGKPNGKR